MGEEKSSVYVILQKIGDSIEGLILDQVDEVHPLQPAFKTLCQNDATRCATWFEAAGEAVLAAYFCNGGHASQGDLDHRAPNAMQHAYLASVLADEWGTADAKVWTDTFEGSATACDSPPGSGGNPMDCANNAAGIDLSTETDLNTSVRARYNVVRNAINNGTNGIVVDQGVMYCEALPFQA